jgi:hypothetical protein
MAGAVEARQIGEAKKPVISLSMRGLGSVF